MLATNYQNEAIAAVSLGLLSVLISFLLPICTRAVKLSRIPLVGKNPGEWFDTKAKQRLVQNWRQTLAEGIKKHPGGFQVVGETSRQVVIPPQYIHLVNTDARFSSVESLTEFLQLEFPGFEGSKSILGDSPTRPLFVTMLRTKLNQNLGRMTEELLAQASDAIDKSWGLDNEWHEIPLRPTALDAVSRMSTRIFLGPELCQNPQWLKIVVDYATNAFMCARILRRYPTVIARILQWFRKDCKVLREQVLATRRLLGPHIQERLETVELAKQGLADMPYDGIVWLDEVAKGQPYDPVTVQLGVSVTAIHTTTDLLSQTVLDLAAHPEMIEPLRREIREVLAENGWEKTALQKMKLLDSVMKETQRVKPISGATTGRYVKEEYKLPNGLVVPEGTFAFSSMQRMWDEEYYPDHDKWDGYRFYNMRNEPGKESRCQLVTTSSEHLGFGHGLHACPGRFLAANECKISIAHILINYDFGFVNDEVPKPIINGIEFYSNPLAKLKVRRRQV